MNVFLMKSKTSESEYNNDLENINIFKCFSHSKPKKPFKCVQYVFGTKKLLQVSTFEYPINLGLYQYFVNCKALVTKCSAIFFYVGSVAHFEFEIERSDKRVQIMAQPL